jgi:L-iditol 2-dehydrogenase
MKAALWYNNKDLRIEEREKPKPYGKDLLVKIYSCGICGSDVVEWYRLPRAPLIPGHEFGGEVVDTGPDQKEYKIGDRVFAAPKVGCGECKYCRKGHHSICPNIDARLEGAFAEYVLVPDQLVDAAVFRLPDTMSYDEATFIEPLACSYRAQKFAGVRKGDRVLVIGCGMSGLLHVKLAVHAGAEVTATDINDNRLTYAANYGATPVNAGKKIKGKFDVVLLCAAALPAFEVAWESADLGGVVVLFTVPAPGKQVVVPVNDFWRKEIKIIHSYYCGPDDLKAAFDLISGKKISVEEMVTHRFPLEKIQEGYRLVTEAGKSIKVIINP